ncbi:MAG: 3-hydroxyacyl-CoA dehydrogenase family protein [Clostridiales Family XIII bacterium]|jgi:carnitine 3-dehydrogenase|nr:3-hydroxyacyl-CoA dehydrogenase family protein [Clostridiales Family XIII bacterium]
MKIAFIGTGMIGTGLAVNAALKGHSVSLAIHSAPITKVQQTVRNILSILEDTGVADKEDAERALTLMGFTYALEEALQDADFVQECSPEQLDIKRKTYRRIQEIAGKKPLIASSASGFFPSALAEGALYPERVIVGHPFNPAYLLPLIEVCGPHAGEENLKFAMEVYRGIGKEPVLCRKERDGFIVNALSRAVMDGSIQAVANDICSVEDIDKALMFGPGMRMAVTGQLLTMSLGVQGGFRMMNQKYRHEGTEDPEKEKMIERIAAGVDEEIANRPEELGNTEDSVIRFRDRAIVEILKIQGKL